MCKDLLPRTIPPARKLGKEMSRSPLARGSHSTRRPTRRGALRFRPDLDSIGNIKYGPVRFRLRLLFDQLEGSMTLLLRSIPRILSALLLAGLAMAVPSHAWAFWGTTGSCESSTLLTNTTFESVESESEDCGTADPTDPTDPAHNLCFADAEGPISTFPALLAEMRAERAAERLIDQTAALTQFLWTAAPDEELRSEPRVKRVPEAPVAIDFGNTPTECSSYEVECREMPPTAPLVHLQNASSTSPMPQHDLSFPPSAELPRSTPSTAYDGIGPALGFASPLEEPPQLA